MEPWVRAARSRLLGDAARGPRRALLLSALLALLALLGSCEPSPAPAHGGDASWPFVSPQRGQALVAKYECHRCHQGTGHPDPPPAKACGGCHRGLAQGRFIVPVQGGEAPGASTLQEWAEHARHLVHVPDLAGAAARLRRDWVVRFLVSPSDVRPALEETMPRLAIGEAEARELATYLTREQPAPAPVRGYANRGRRLLEDKGCTGCHAFTGVPPLRVVAIQPTLSADALRTALALAPDLRHARERMWPATMVEWIVDPRALQPTSAMPPSGVSREEAMHIVTYIMTASLAAPSPPPPFARLPPLNRRVTFGEVSTAVFRGSCWHCHSDPDYNSGDGGPGNTGGFGYSGKGIQLATYEGVLSGYVDAAGRRRSLLAAGPGERSRLVASLLARHAEEAGAPRADVLGMPLGLPALTAEQIQLVETWVLAGAPP